MEAVIISTIVMPILTKAIEKNGEKITDAVWAVAGKLLGKLKVKKPLTGMKVEQVQQNPALMEEHRQDFGVEVLEAEIVEASKDDEVLTLMQELVAMVQTENMNLSRMAVLRQVVVQEGVEIEAVEQEGVNGRAVDMVVAEDVKAGSLKIGKVIQRS